RSGRRSLDRARRTTRMHRLSRLHRLAASAMALATLIVGLAASPVAAAASPVVGHVYVNNNSATRNTVAGFDRHANGSLTPIAGSPFDAGGAGTGAAFGAAGGPRDRARRSATLASSH